MRHRLSVYQISALSVALASFLLAVIRIIVLKENIEPAGDAKGFYYILNNTETVVYLVFTCCFALAFTCVAFIIGKKANSFIPFDSSPVVFSSSLCGFMFLATGLYYSYQFFTDHSVSGSRFAIALSMVFASAMFLDLALLKEGKKRKSITYLRFIVCGYSILRLVLDFIEQNRHPANSAVSFHILSLIAFMLFIVYEGKLEFSPGSMRAYLISGYLCVLFMLVYAIPNLVITLMDITIDPYILFSAVDISIAFFVLTRTFSVCYTKPKS